ncbi:unnamed protein product, partial [Mesorhabditis spiculigera]
MLQELGDCTKCGKMKQTSGRFGLPMCRGCGDWF